MAKTAYLFDPVYLEHKTEWGHPERPDRLIAIDTLLRQQPYFNELVRVEKKIPDLKYIEMIHDPEYIARAKRTIEGGETYFDSMDTSVCARSYEVALYAVGGCLNMCDCIMKGKARHGFCAVRPPGHHAERNQSAGFCIFNNVAISARYVQKEYGIERVAIVDWDVHHGNGTQHSFEDDDSIYYISLHQYPYYPGTGAEGEKGFGGGKGYTLNLPMRMGSGDEEYLSAFEDFIVPELEDFAPQVIFISAGFDAHRDDPLSAIELRSETFYKFTKLIQDVARGYADDRIIAVLEGGYELDALADSVERVMQAFVEA
jgi:acetoin utilization deacetylase AcuC-like enzyme